MGTCRLFLALSPLRGVRLSAPVGIAALALAAAWPAHAGPKLDKDTCAQLKAEQTTFMASGIVEDLQRGPAWGKANLTAERLREIEHFILLDEQLKFGCRQVTLTEDVLRAGEAASRIENPQPAAPAAPQDGGAARPKAGQDGERQSAVEGGASPPGTTGGDSSAAVAAPTGLAGDAVDVKPVAKPQPKPKPPAATAGTSVKPKTPGESQKPAAVNDE